MQLSIEILDDNGDSEEKYKQYVNILEAQLDAKVVAAVLRGIADEIEAKTEKPKQASPFVPPYTPSPPFAPVQPYITPGVKPGIYADGGTITTHNTDTAQEAVPTHDGRGPG